MMIVDDISFDTIKAFVEHLCHKVSKDYECIIALSRGGLIPGVMLSHMTGIRMKSFGIKSYGDDKTPGDIKITQQIPLLEHRDEKVLVVDDICDSGATFNYIREVFQAAGISVETAALFAKPDSVKFCDYHVRLANPDTWITFPWES